MPLCDREQLNRFERGFGVSILVLVDAALRHQIVLLWSYYTQVSILVLVDAALRLGLSYFLQLKRVVSILVLVDAALRLYHYTMKAQIHKFQSLF